MVGVKIEIQSSGKWMTSNHKEYSNDITLEHLNLQYEITSVIRIFAEKVTKKFEVINQGIKYLIIALLYIWWMLHRT